MLDSLTADDIAAEVQMLRAGFKGCIILTEGDTDVLIFERFTSEDRARFIPAWGKANAIDAISLISETPLKVISIIDSDFDTLLGVSASHSNIFKTDFHDIEISTRVSGYKCHSINWLEFKGSKILQSDSVSS